MLLADIFDNKNVNILCDRREQSEGLKNNEPGPKNKKKKRKEKATKLFREIHSLLTRLKTLKVL